MDTQMCPKITLTTSNLQITKDTNELKSTLTAATKAIVTNRYERKQVIKNIICLHLENNMNWY